MPTRSAWPLVIDRLRRTLDSAIVDAHLCDSRPLRRDTVNGIDNYAISVSSERAAAWCNGRLNMQIKTVFADAISAEPETFTLIFEYTATEPPQHVIVPTVDEDDVSDVYAGANVGELNF